MLRNLNKSSGGRRILGTWHVGMLAATIAAETVTGDNGPGLLYDEAINPANAGKQLRCRITGLPSAGTLFVHENGAFDFSGAPDGSYTVSYAVDADVVQISTDSATLLVGVVNASVAAGTGTSAGAGSGGAATGAGGTNAIASGGAGVSTGSGTGGAATGGTSPNASADGGTGTSIGSGSGGSPSNGSYVRAPEGSGPVVIQLNTSRPRNLGGRRL